MRAEIVEICQDVDQIEPKIGVGAGLGWGWRHEGIDRDGSSLGGADFCECG